MPARTIFLNGTVGSGKTTTASAVAALLRARGIPHAVIDTDALRDRWPAPAEDPFDLVLELRNLAAVAGNMRAAGCVVLVVSGVIERVEDLEGYWVACGGYRGDRGREGDGGNGQGELRARGRADEMEASNGTGEHIAGTHTSAAGTHFVLVRLNAPAAVLDRRLVARHDDEDEREWHRRRAPELNAILDAAGLPGPTVDTAAPLADVARAVLEVCGWEDVGEGSE